MRHQYYTWLTRTRHTFSTATSALRRRLAATRRLASSRICMYTVRAWISRRLGSNCLQQGQSNRYGTTLLQRPCCRK